MIYLSDSGGVYDYTADEPPVVGQVVKLDAGTIWASVESIEVGELSNLYTAVRASQPHAQPRSRA